MTARLSRWLSYLVVSSALALFSLTGGGQLYLWPIYVGVTMALLILFRRHLP